MKKLTVALLVMLFMAFSLTGCGKKCDDCGKSKLSGVHLYEMDDGEKVNLCKKCHEERLEALIEETFEDFEMPKY